MIATETDLFFIRGRRRARYHNGALCPLALGKFLVLAQFVQRCWEIKKKKERKWHWGVFFSFEFSLLVKERKDFSTYASVSLVVTRRLRLGCALLRSAKAIKITAMTPQAPPAMVNQDNSWSTESLQYLCMGEVDRMFQCSCESAVKQCKLSTNSQKEPTKNEWTRMQLNQLMHWIDIYSP